MDRFFRIVSGLEKSEYKLISEESVIVGRSEEESQWVIRDPDISRKHMRLFYRNNCVWVEDLESTNGVFVNRQKITVPIKIEEKDIILIGQTSISVVPNKESLEKPVLGKQLSASRKPIVKEVQTSMMIPGMDAQELPRALSHIELHKKLDLLYQISSAGNLPGDLNSYYDFVFKNLHSHLEYRRIVALYLNGDKYEVIHYHTSDDSEFDINLLSQTIIDLCVENQQVISSNFIQGDERFKSSESLRRQVPLAVLCAPLLVDGKVLGALLLDVENYKKVFSMEDMMLFAACAANLAWALNHNLTLKNIVEKERNEADLRIARDIQQSSILRPDKLPKVIGLDLASLYKPYDVVGGDYYDIVVNSNKTVIVSADVSGKGVSAALVVSMLRAYTKTILQNQDDPQLALVQLQQLFENELPKKMFVTASLATIDLNQKTVSVCRAGHTYLIHYSKSKKSVKLVGGKGIMIGVGTPEIFKLRLEKNIISIGSGDVLMLYTDGLSEVRNSRNELFGDERLAECVGHFAHLNANEILNAIQKSLFDFGGEDGVLDDMCAVVVKII